MNFRIFFACIILLAITVRPYAEEPIKEDLTTEIESESGALEIVPASAMAAIAIRDFAELSDRGDEFILKTEIRVPMRFSDGYRFLLGYLGIQNGVDIHGSASLSLLGAKQDIEGLVLAVPMKDPATMAANFNIPAKDFVPGRVLDRQDYKNAKAPDVTRYLAVRGKHLLMGFDKNTVDVAANDRSLSDSVSEELRDTLSRDDLLIFVRGKLAQEMVSPTLKSLQRSNEQELDSLLPFFALSEELDHVAAGIRLKDGVGATMVLGFKGDRSKESLERLSRGSSNASMIGLPEGRVVVAHMGGGDGDDSVSATQSLLKLLMEYYSVSLDQMISEVRRSKLMTVFTEAWQRADGSCSALYQNPKPDEQGEFSLITILRTDGGEEFIRDMSALIPPVNAALLPNEETDTSINEEMIEDWIDHLAHSRYRVRQLASSKLILVGEPAVPLLKQVSGTPDPEVRARIQSILGRIQRNIGAERKSLLEGDLLSQLRPRLSYLENQETHGGQEVDLVRIRLIGSDRSKADAMKRLFGSQWQTIRVAVVNDDVVLMMGSNTTLLDATIRNLQNRSDGISPKRFAFFRDRVETKTKVEFHVGMARAASLIAGDHAAPSQAANETTSIGLSVSSQQIRVDVFSPFEDFKTMAKRMNW